MDHTVYMTITRCKTQTFVIGRTVTDNVGEGGTSIEDWVNKTAQLKLDPPADRQCNWRRLAVTCSPTQLENQASSDVLQALQRCNCHER